MLARCDMLKFLKIGVFVSLCFVSGTVFAKTSFLPDYVSDNLGRSSDSTRGGGSSASCATYGYPTECPEYTVLDGPVIPRPGLTCYKRCVCDTGHFSVTGCDRPKVPGGKSCTKDGTKYYESCVCPADYNLSSCPEGAICEKCGDLFKFVSCDKDNGWERASGGFGFFRINMCVPAQCPKGYKVDNGSCSGDTPDEDCSGLSGGKDCCKCVCDNGTSKKCPESEYPLTSEPENGSAISCNYGCGSTKVTRYKAVRCDEDYKLQNGVCVAKTCKEVNSKYEPANLANGKCKEVTTKAGVKCYTDCVCDEDYKLAEGQCVAKTCKEVDSRLVEVCPDGFVGIEVKTKSGRPCFKDCKDPNDPATVCKGSGYEDSAVSGKICKKVTVNNVTCYECSASPACGTGILNPTDNIVYNAEGNPIALLYDGQYYKPMAYDNLYCGGGVPSTVGTGGAKNMIWAYNYHFIGEGSGLCSTRFSMFPPLETAKQIKVFCDSIGGNNEIGAARGFGTKMGAAFCYGNSGQSWLNDYCSDDRTKANLAYYSGDTLNVVCSPLNDYRDYVIGLVKCSITMDSSTPPNIKEGEVVSSCLSAKAGYFSCGYHIPSGKYVANCDGYTKTRTSTSVKGSCSTGHHPEYCPYNKLKYYCAIGSDSSSSGSSSSSSKCAGYDYKAGDQCPGGAHLIQCADDSSKYRCGY